MNEEMKARIENTMNNLRRNRMEAYYCDTSVQAKELVKTLLKKGDTVSCGGSVTLKETGIDAHSIAKEYNCSDSSACDARGEVEEI